MQVNTTPQLGDDVKQDRLVLVHFFPNEQRRQGPAGDERADLASDRHLITYKGFFIMT